MLIEKSEFDLLFNVSAKLGDRDTNLLHSIAVTDGNTVVAFLGIVADGVEVNGYAERSADLVLTAISLTDRACIVVVNAEVLGKLLVDLGSFVGKLLGKGKNCNLEGRKEGVETENGSYVVLCLVNDLLVVSVAKHGENGSLNAERGLNDVGNVVLVGLLIEVGKILARNVLVLGKVVVGTVSNAPELAPTEGEEELEVGGCLGVEAKLLGIVVAQTNVFFLKTDGKKPITAEGSPIVEPLEVGTGFAEELKLHLLKLSYTEDEVTGSDLVTEGLTDLCDTEGKLLSCGSLNVYKVCEYTLSGLGTEINGVLCVLGNALEGLEHEIELSYISEVVLSTGGAGNIVVLNKILHFLLRKCVDGLRKNVTGLAAPVLDELIGTETLLTFLTVHKRIGKSCKVTRCNPGLRVHKDSSVKTYVILVFLNELFPPSTLDVVFELNSERAVVPGVCKTAVNFGACEYVASALTKSNYFVHCFFGV